VGFLFRKIVESSLSKDFEEQKNQRSVGCGKFLLLPIKGSRATTQECE